MAEAISTTNGHLELQFPIIAGSLRYLAGKYCKFFPLSFMFSNKMSKVVAQLSYSSFSIGRNSILQRLNSFTATRHNYKTSYFVTKQLEAFEAQIGRPKPFFLQ